MPNWNQSFTALVMLSIAGYALVIASGYWHVIALIVIAIAMLWFWRRSRR